jgi:hypothetical protein
VEQIMRGFRFVLPVVASVFLAGAVQAAPTVGALVTTEAAFNANLATAGVAGNPVDARQFVGIARIGNNSSTATTVFTGGLWETALFKPFPNPPTFSNGVGAPGNRDWGSAANVTLSRTGDNVTFSVDGFTQTIAGMTNVNTLGVQARATDPATSSVPLNTVTWRNLQLSSPTSVFPPQSVGTATATSSPNGPFEIYQVISNLVGDFVLTGTIALTFDASSLPPSSQLAFRIAGYVATSGGGGDVTIPVPAALALFGIGLVALAGVSARRRA